MQLGCCNVKVSYGKECSADDSDSSDSDSSSGGDMMCDPVTCQYFNFVDNGISGWKCCDGMTCTNGKDPTGMTCDVDCGSSGQDVAGMDCGTAPTPTPPTRPPPSDS